MRCENNEENIKEKLKMQIFIRRFIRSDRSNGERTLEACLRANENYTTVPATPWFDASIH